MMGAFICKQPNGLYCRFSTVVDNPTHWNMSEEDYINYRKEAAVEEAEWDARQTLRYHLGDFKDVSKLFRPNTISRKRFNEVLKEMETPVENIIPKRSERIGSFGVGLDNPKHDVNVGSALRGCGCFGASFLVVGNKRISCWTKTDTEKSVYTIPVFRTDDIMAEIPFNHVPVAVELTDGAANIVDYEHPLNAFYIFGAEDATLGHRILSRCRDVIRIPSNYCLNLACSVNVVLYDRVAKMQRKQQEKAQ